MDICILLAAGLLVFWILMSKKHKRTPIMYGYPPYHSTWLTVYHVRGTDEWIFEWDDLFDTGRPVSLGPISENILFEESSATKEEIKEAKRRLKSRGLWK